VSIDRLLTLATGYTAEGGWSADYTQNVPTASKPTSGWRWVGNCLTHYCIVSFLKDAIRNLMWKTPF